MTSIPRRHFTGLAAVAAGALAMPSVASGAAPRVVVVGGGAGGATAARYIAKDSKGAIDVSLVEASRQYTTCFFSNLYIGGFQNYSDIGHDYEGLATNHGINIVHGWADTVDRKNRVVHLAGGGSLAYDRLVLSPGIDMKYDSVAGYSAEAQSRMPHGWKSGTQAQLIKHQVMNMPQGGTFIMVAPAGAFRCPPGPYERISMIAHLLTQHNPTAKIIVLDMKEKFSKQTLFTDGWQKYYPGMVEWLGVEDHGGILGVDPDAMTIETDLDTFKADAASVIPAQKAGSIAFAAGLTDGDWCPIVPATMASRKDAHIHVLGDAAAASSMPKSAFSANSQAKVAANAIRGELTGARVFEPRFSNTCWSLIAGDDGVKIGASYRAGEDKLEAFDNFVSQKDESRALRKQTYEESLGWYRAIIADMFS